MAGSHSRREQGGQESGVGLAGFRGVSAGSAREGGVRLHRARARPRNVASVASLLRGVEGGSRDPPRSPFLEIDSGQPPKDGSRFLA